MADENKAPETEETSANADAQPTDTTAVADATGDAGQQSLDLTPAEGDAAPKPSDAAGEPSAAGDEASAATEADPMPEAPVADEVPGTSVAPTPDAAALSDEPAENSAYVGADQEAPEAQPTPDVSAPEAQPALDAPADSETKPEEQPSVSTGIGGDKASDVTPPDAPKIEAQPAPEPAPSAPGLFNHGTPINLPDMAIPSDQGYPVAQEGVPPAHPQHFGTLVNDGVGDDAGKVAGPTEYPVAPAPTQVDGEEGKEDEEGESDKGDEEAQEPEAAKPEAEDAGEPSAIPPHVEHRLSKMFKKIVGLEEKIERLLKEFLG